MEGPASKSRLLMGLFLVGCIVFNYPILTLFNRQLTLFGIPLLYLYLFVVWTLFIVAIMLITRGANRTSRLKRLRARRLSAAVDRNA